VTQPVPFPAPETVSEKTSRQYARHATAVRNACEDDLGGRQEIASLITWFIARNDEFAASTIRGYRAGLRHALDCELTTGKLDAERHKALLERLAEGPTAKPKGRDRKTSSRKKKTVGDDLVARLLEALGKSLRRDGFDEFLVDYVKFSLTFFPRPSEWAGASIVHVTNRETGAVEMRRLRFANSKHSNGRSFGPTRDLDISDDLNFVRDLMHFLRVFRTWVSAMGSPVKLQVAIRNRLAYVSKSARLPRVSPYSFRHAGMAAAKEDMDQLQVSYAAGHGSDRTKIDNYARSRPSSGGWVSPKDAFSIPAERAAVVRQTGRVMRNRRSIHSEAKAEFKGPRP
jgi:integrase